MEEDPRERTAICCKRKRIKKDKREEFLRDWLKDVGAEGEEESESEENEEEMEADLSRKLPQNRSRNPTSYLCSVGVVGQLRRQWS